MYELKTKRSDTPVSDVLAGIPEKYAADCARLCDILREEVGELFVFGKDQLGAGVYHYMYKSGQHGEWYVAGFAARKSNLTIYMSGGYDEAQAPHLAKLGKYKHSVSCLYVNRLADIDEAVLRQMLRQNTATLEALYPGGLSRG